MANSTPLNNAETAAFCSQMAMVLAAGISPYEGIMLMIEDAKSEDEKTLLTAMNEKILMTGSLYEAVSEAGVFPEYMVSMIQIGEQTGHSDDVMRSLADYYEKEANLAVTIKNAITYPFIMVLTMIAVIIVLITKVLPIFDQVFKQLGTEMNGLSRVFLSLGNFLNKHFYIPVLLIVVLIVLGVYFAKSKSGQAKSLAFASRFKITSILADTVAKYRFTNGMALTLSSGLTPEDCLKYASDVVTDSKLAGKVAECRKRVAMGIGLGEVLLETEIFTGLQARMMNIALKTGVLDEVLSNIAKQYEDEIDNRISKLLSSIEPTLVVILSIAVGIILLSVMLPLINIMSAL